MGWSEARSNGGTEDLLAIGFSEASVGGPIVEVGLIVPMGIPQVRSVHLVLPPSEDTLIGPRRRRKKWKRKRGGGGREERGEGGEMKRQESGTPLKGSSQPECLGRRSPNKK